MKNIFEKIKDFFVRFWKGIIGFATGFLFLIVIIAVGIFCIFKVIAKGQIKKNGGTILENEDYINSVNDILNKLKLFK
jgi:uncharacterized membrane protein